MCFRRCCLIYMVKINILKRTDALGFNDYGTNFLKREKRRKQKVH